MTGFGSNIDLTINDLEKLRQSLLGQGMKIVDLTSGNPTENGIAFPCDILGKSFEAYFRSRHYSPHAQGLLQARQAIAEYYSRSKCNELANSENIFITASTSEAYSLLFSLLCEPGDNVLVPTPSYPLFDLLALHANIELKSYNLAFNPNLKTWDIDESSIQNSVDSRTRAVLIVSPHNPTGHILNQTLNTLNDLGLPIIADEVFYEFSLHGAADRLPVCSYYPNLPVFSLNGISKMFALPDLKLGWIGLNNIAATRYHERLQLLNDLFLSANIPTQYALRSIFQYGPSVSKQMIDRARANLQRIESLLGPNYSIELLQPSFGLALILSLPGGCDEEQVVLSMLKQGFVIHPGYFYDIDSFPAVIVSLLSSTEALELGITALLEILCLGDSFTYNACNKVL